MNKFDKLFNMIMEDVKNSKLKTRSVENDVDPWDDRPYKQTSCRKTFRFYSC